MNRSDTLKAELFAIDRWDTWYWKSKDPVRYEIVAHVQRRRRRAEIIRELVRQKTSSNSGEDVPAAPHSDD
jgi:hypothetical protein